MKPILSAGFREHSGKPLFKDCIDDYFFRELDRVRVIDKIDDVGDSLILAHRGLYLRTNICPKSRDTFFRIFPANEEYSEKLERYFLAEVVIFMGDVVPVLFRGPIVAHEVAEALMITDGTDPKKAHDFGVFSENEYVLRFLNRSQNKYVNWRMANYGR
ncbi:hypothetical protein J4447_01245 [Candidatus Pacearchaeota archaeon]|nr:hypothetical protein [Candidatus Pacearchaeota archaeon]